MAFVPPILDFNFKIEGDEEIKRRFSQSGAYVQRTVRSTLETLAREVVLSAKSRAPRSANGSGRRLADFIGYRFTLGKSGIKPDEGDRVIVRSDIGARGDQRAKAYAVEMGHIGRRRTVRAHSRHNKRGDALGVGKNYAPSNRRMSSGVSFVKEYQRRFANKAQPFIGPAAEAMRSEITQALTVALPRRLARYMNGEGMEVA